MSGGNCCRLGKEIIDDFHRITLVVPHLRSDTSLKNARIRASLLSSGGRVPQLRKSTGPTLLSHRRLRDRPSSIVVWNPRRPLQPNMKLPFGGSSIASTTSGPVRRQPADTFAWIAFGTCWNSRGHRTSQFPPSTSRVQKVKVRPPPSSPRSLLLPEFGRLCSPPRISMTLRNGWQWMAFAQPPRV